MTLYIAQCFAVLRGTKETHVATLVGEAATPEDLQVHAQTFLAAKGHTLVALQQIVTVQDHLRRHGETELVMALLSAINDAALVQVSGFYATGNQFKSFSADPVLAIEHRPFTPIDANSDLPFWDRPWCPIEFAPLLFGDPRRSFMIIDAGRRRELRGGFDIDDIEMILDTRCLYTGATADDLREVAPYLVDITPCGENGAPIPAPLRDLFSKQLAGGAVIFLRAACDVDSLQRHLRHFLRIRSSDEADNWTYFRFWDPAVARVYFSGISSRAERVDRIFRITPDVPLEVITSKDAEAIRFYPVDAKGRAQMQASIVFDAQDHALMQTVATTAFHAETTTWLREGYPQRFKDFDAIKMDAAVAHIMSQGTQVGCKLKDDYVYLAHIMITLGGWFHLSGHPKALVEVLRNPPGSLNYSLKSKYLSIWETTPQAALIECWERLSAHIASIPVKEQISPQEFSKIAVQFFSKILPSVDAALAATKLDLARLDLSRADQGRLLFLTLVYGHRFYEDPFRAWSNLQVLDAINAAWAQCFN